jgi:hypothetical protein
MNESSHPIHESRLVTNFPRLKASPRHGGAKRFQHFFSHLNCRGGALPRAAAFIAMKNDNPSLMISDYHDLHGKSSMYELSNKYSVVVVRLTPSLLWRGRHPKGNSLDPLSCEIFN